MPAASTCCIRTTISRSNDAIASALAPGALDLALAQHEALHLAGLGARQAVGELDGARILVGRDALLDEILQRAGELGRRGLAGAQHDESLDDRAAVGVGRADHRAFGD